jgi:hypothetical protein
LPQGFFKFIPLNSNIFQPELFKRMIPFIIRMEERPLLNSWFIEMAIPKNFTIDNSQALLYFHSDATIAFTRGKGERLHGTLKDPEIADYIAQEYFKKQNCFSQKDPEKTSFTRKLLNVLYDHAF